jgi:glycosyltransferase involved in cell wall biosynthesis
LYAVISGQLAETPVIVTRPVLIDDYKAGTVKRKIYKAVDTLSLQLASRIVAVSQSGGQRLLRERNVSRDKIEVITNGVELKEFQPRGSFETEDPKEASRRIRVVGCGQLTKNKGWVDFIEVATEMSEASYQSFECIIVGDGPEREKLESIVEGENLGNIVTFVGFQTDVASWLKTADVFLTMSHREGLPMAVLEAMACGLPVVATDAGGTGELIKNGKTGYLLEVGDIRSAVCALRWLIRSPDRRRKMGEAARDTVEEEYSFEAMVSQYLNLYEYVANNQ